MNGQVVEVNAAHKATSGGSSDTEVKELTTIPTGPSCVCAVTRTTPVVNRPSTSRNERGVSTVFPPFNPVRHRLMHGSPTPQNSGHEI